MEHSQEENLLVGRNDKQRVRAILERRRTKGLSHSQGTIGKDKRSLLQSRIRQQAEH